MLHHLRLTMIDKYKYFMARIVNHSTKCELGSSISSGDTIFRNCLFLNPYSQ